MDKHTQGPWIFNADRMNVLGKVNDRFELIAQIADMPCVNGHDDLAAERGMDMERANARLIASAPDMLEALRYYAAIKGPMGEPARQAIAKIAAQ